MAEYYVLKNHLYSLVITVCYWFTLVCNTIMKYFVCLSLFWLCLQTELYNKAFNYFHVMLFWWLISIKGKCNLSLTSLGLFFCFSIQYILLKTSIRSLLVCLFYWNPFCLLMKFVIGAFSMLTEWIQIEVKYSKSQTYL